MEGKAAKEYKNMWDDRYKDPDYAYGKEPNLFFREWIQHLQPGKILMPADGEGRNGVYAATLGWKVTSFDLSKEGKVKALQLAEENNVTIDYFVGDFEQLEFEEKSFDAVALIYAHVAADKKSAFHKKVSRYLKPEGVIILEAFSKRHLEYNCKNPQVGGPKNIEMLFSAAEIESDFDNFDIPFLEEKEVDLTEGKYHIGKGSVIQFIGEKRT